MSEMLLLGIGRLIVPVPGPLWRRLSARRGRETQHPLAFMTPDHHRVRNYVVLELPRAGHPLAPEAIAQALDLPIGRVMQVLDDLEQHLTFLYRDPAGAVVWAYPVTAAATPHHLAFSSGERIDAAWGVDALATPFVQGRLRGQSLSVTIETACAHCGMPIALEVGSDMQGRVLTPGASPLVFSPLVDFGRLREPSITDVFWRRSVFFQSEEHARAHRRQHGGGRGIYLTLAQALYVTPIMQGALFPRAWMGSAAPLHVPLRTARR